MTHTPSRPAQIERMASVLRRAEEDFFRLSDTRKKDTTRILFMARVVVEYLEGL